MEIVILILTIFIPSIVITFLGYLEIISFEKLFRIKWELLISISLFIVTVMMFSILVDNPKDYRSIILVFISTFMFISSILFYNKIKEIRHFLINVW